MKILDFDVSVDSLHIFWVLLLKFLAFNVSAYSLHLFYGFFASVFFILMFLHIGASLFVMFFVPIKIYFSGGFYMNVHLLLMFLLFLFISFTISLLHVLDIVVSLFVTFFRTINMIFLSFFYESSWFWCFGRSSSYFFIVSLFHFFKSFWFSIFRVHLTLSFHNIMFISFATNLDFLSNFRSVFFSQYVYVYGSIIYCFWWSSYQKHENWGIGAIEK